MKTQSTFDHVLAATFVVGLGGLAIYGFLDNTYDIVEAAEPLTAFEQCVADSSDLIAPPSMDDDPRAESYWVMWCNEKHNNRG